MREVVARERIGQESRHQTLAFPAIIDLGAWRQSSFPWPRRCSGDVRGSHL